MEETVYMTSFLALQAKNSVSSLQAIQSEMFREVITVYSEDPMKHTTHCVVTHGILLTAVCIYTARITRGPYNG
jgi:hypothetical protein